VRRRTLFEGDEGISLNGPFSDVTIFRNSVFKRLKISMGYKTGSASSKVKRDIRSMRLNELIFKKFILVNTRRDMFLY
jgi:hypothetical protein